ncbi:RGS21 protein, partial [Amia calva]|nr:RGS21 protein [Amia calva]
MASDINMKPRKKQSRARVPVLTNLKIEHSWVLFWGGRRGYRFKRDPGYVGVELYALGEKEAGQIAFREFLKTEYSEENILFWLACEEYKKIKSTPKMVSTANQIYTEYVQVEAPRQINIDCGTREYITQHISEPNINSFDNAQKIIYGLLARDCYPRFLKSEIYQAILRRPQKTIKKR